MHSASSSVELRKSRLVLSIGIFSLLVAHFGGGVINPAFAQGSEELKYESVSGTFERHDLGISVALPDAMEGFVYEYGPDDEVRGLTLQIHPEFDSSSEPCCPVIDVTPAAFLLSSDILDALATPVPFTGDVYAAIQGYNMRMSVDEVNGKEVLVAILDSERDDIPGYDVVRRVGKFYLMNNEERYVSYGLWASEENYQKYLDQFEKSAASLMIQDATSVNLTKMFSHYSADFEVRLDEGSTLYPKVITPSVIESVSLDEESNTLKITVVEPTGNSFIIVDSGNLLEGPLNATIDGESAESEILTSQNDEWLVVYYDLAGEHEISITGTAIVPEFGHIAAFLMAAGIFGTILLTARNRQFHLAGWTHL